MKLATDGVYEISLVPGIVNLAFSIELYIKYLIAIHEIPPKKHELTKLFKLLDPVTQNEIITMTNYERAELELLSNKHSEPFVNWRYLYDRIQYIDKSDGTLANVQFMKRLARSLESIANRQ